MGILELLCDPAGSFARPLHLNWKTTHENLVNLLCGLGKHSSRQDPSSKPRPAPLANPYFSCVHPHSSRSSRPEGPRRNGTLMSLMGLMLFI